MSYRNEQQVAAKHMLQPSFSGFFLNSNTMVHHTTNLTLEQIQGFALYSQYGYDHLLVPNAHNSSDDRVVVENLAIPTNYVPPYNDRERISRALVLDSSKGEIVNAPQKAAEQERALVASKIHSEAERRRRERINSHLATLRTILPSSFKIDKASLLGEVVEQVKKLKRKVFEMCEYGKAMPTESNEVKVEREHDISLTTSGDRIATLRVSLCCEDRADLMSSIKQIFDLLQIRIIKAEISTLGGRIKNVFVVTPRASSPEQKEKDGDLQDVDAMIKQVRDALKLVVERPGGLEDSTQGKPSRRRQRQRVL